MAHITVCVGMIFDLFILKECYSCETGKQRLHPTKATSNASHDSPTTSKLQLKYFLLISSCRKAFLVISARCIAGLEYGKNKLERIHG